MSRFLFGIFYNVDSKQYLVISPKSPDSKKNKKTFNFADFWITFDGRLKAKNIICD